MATGADAKDANMNRLAVGDACTRSLDIVTGITEQLKKLLPDAFTEGRVDFDRLRQLLGGAVEERDEKFGLTWPGKRRSRQLALTPSTGTLRPCQEDSADWDSTRNLMIEGDNLEVLKLLQKSYAGRVRLIYIDPPYNTGNDFVYADNFKDNIKNYLELTGQTEGGRKITSNPESSGRFHTDWLNMMYPRLRLARNLLSMDGVILVSIGDEEIHNLRGMCDELFGPENFCGAFIWEKKKKPSFLDRNMGTVTDYIVAYARDRDRSPAFGAGAVEDGKKYPFNNAGNSLTVLRFPANSVQFACDDQLIQAQDMSEGDIKTSLLDDVQVGGGKNANAFRLRGEWRYSQAKLDEFVAAHAEITISKVPFRPNYVNRSGELKKTSNLLSYRQGGMATNEDATEEMRRTFGADVMSYPKPSRLLKYLVRAVSSGDDVVMDFFAGSGTTAVGTLLQNAEDGGSRRYILVQLPEPLDPSNHGQKVASEYCDALEKPRNIAELTKERLRRAARMIAGDNPTFAGDLGFRVFRLDSTNIRAWEPDRENLPRALEESVEHVKADRTEADVLYELLLKRGLDLCVPIERQIIAGKAVHSIGGGALVACLADSLTREEVEQVASGIVAWHKAVAPAGETTCVFRDSAFSDDVAKTNLVAILEQHEINSVLSI
jgi:adenine-specific DNA-methyltransferase